MRLKGQREAGRRIGERITDVTFWKNELSSELDKLLAECKILSDFKKNIAKSLQVSCNIEILILLS